MFLVKRPNSQNWQIEIRFPREFQFPMIEGGLFKWRHHFTMSMGTPDRAEAEIKAAPYIHQYRILMYQWNHAKRGHNNSITADEGKPIRFGSRSYPDGLHVIDGEKAMVFGETILFLGSDGRPVRSAPNPKRLIPVVPGIDDPETAKAFLYFDPDAEIPKRFIPERAHPDDQLIEAYIQDRALRPAIATDARSTWRLYKQVIGKPLSKSTRKDGKAFAAHLASLGLARATVQKKVGWLAAACAHAIADDANLAINPFSRVLPPSRPGDAKKRRPFTEGHMALCFRNLELLSSSDRLLWLLLAKTGMRLGEAISIRQEFRERGTNIRYVEVGTKTDASHRNVPLPLDIGLPDLIERRLFTGTAAAASKRLNRFIKASIPDWSPELVVHSLRHRAVEVFRLVDNGGDPHLRRRLVGHAAIDVHELYGSFGPPMSLLLPIIEANPVDGSLVIGPHAKSRPPLPQPD